MLRFIFILSLSFSLVGCMGEDKSDDIVRSEKLSLDLEKFDTYAPVPERPLSLSEVIAFALERNLELLVQQHELEIQREMSSGERLKMLPSLSFGGELSNRNKVRGTGVVSSERETKKADLTLAWSLLDFGLSYYNAKREDNRTKIIELHHKRIRQNLVLDLIGAYWKTIVAREAASGAQELIKLAELNQENIQGQVSRRLVSEMQGLQAENQLIEIQAKLYTFRNEYYSAKAELASLMGVAPGAKFSLENPKIYSIDNVDYSLSKLEDTALRSRPELFVQDIEEEILVDDVHATMIEMFPNLNLFASNSYDADSFLLHQDWFSTGIKASWNLFAIPSLQKKRNSLQAQQKQVASSRMALSFAVLTQVHLAHLEYVESNSQYALSKELHSVKSRLLQAGKKEHEQGLIDDVDLFNFKVESLFSQINTLKAYASLHVSLEKIGNSAGKPLSFYPEKGKVQEAMEEFKFVQSLVDAQTDPSIEELQLIPLEAFDLHKIGEIEKIEEKKVAPSIKKEKGLRPRPQYRFSS